MYLDVDPIATPAAIGRARGQWTERRTSWSGDYVGQIDTRGAIGLTSGRRLGHCARPTGSVDRIDHRRWMDADPGRRMAQPQACGGRASAAAASGVRRPRLRGGGLRRAAAAPPRRRPQACGGRASAVSATLAGSRPFVDASAGAAPWTSSTNPRSALPLSRIQS